MKRSSWLTLRAALLTAVTAEFACGRAPMGTGETGDSLGTSEGSGSAADGAATSSAEVSSAASDSAGVDTGEADVTTTAGEVDGGEAEVTTTDAEAGVTTSDGGDGDGDTTTGTSVSDASSTDASSADVSTTDTGGDGDGDTTGGDGDGDMDPIFEDEACPFEGATRCFGDVLRECSSPESGSMWSYVESCDWCLDLCQQGFARCHDFSYDACGGQCFDPTVGTMGCAFPLGGSFSPLTGTVVFDGGTPRKIVDPTTCDTADGFYPEEVMTGEWVLNFCGEACVDLNDSASMEVFEECLVPGRPLMVDGALQAASVESIRGWTSSISGVEAGDAELAARYAEVGRIEHASVASFARFITQLLAVGAPARFVQDAQAALADEIEHAKMAFALASAYAGHELGPGPLAQACAPIGAEFDDIVWATFEEGCINETLAAAEAGQMAQALPVGPQRDFWERVAADETRHAALAWGFVAWAWTRIGAQTRARIQSRGEQAASRSRCDARPPRLLASELWDERRRAELAEVAMAELVAPAMQRLVA